MNIPNLALKSGYVLAAVILAWIIVRLCPSFVHWCRYDSSSERGELARFEDEFRATPENGKFHYLQGWEEDGFSIMKEAFRPGTSKRHVKGIMGLPQNEDRDDVWVWMDGYSDYRKNHGVMHWNEMTMRNRAVFILFRNDRVVCPAGEGNAREIERRLCKP